MQPYGYSRPAQYPCVTTVKKKIEPNGNYSIEDADQLMDQWFYFVFSKTIGASADRIVYDVNELMVDGKVRKPLYQLKKSPEISEYVIDWCTQVSNDVGKKFWSDKQ